MKRANQHLIRPCASRRPCSVADTFNLVNGVYEQQANIHLTVGPVHVESANGGAVWNEQPSATSGVRDCEHDLSEKLSQLAMVGANQLVA